MSLETEVKVLSSVVSKIDTTIEKLTELSNNISKLLAVHDERLDQLERANGEKADDIKDIHSRITTISREICDKLDQVEDVLEKRLQEHSEKSDTYHRSIKSELDGKLKTIDDRVSLLERWRWIIIGGAAVVGYIIDKLVSFLA